MSGIVLSASVRQNLLSLQSTASLLATTQNDLSTGNKVNTALDNPTEYFTAQGLNNRASDINNLLDGIGNGVQVLQAANTGLTSLQSLVASAQSIANQVLQAPTGYTTRSSVTTTAISGATANNLLGTQAAYTSATATAGTAIVEFDYCHHRDGRNKAFGRYDVDRRPRDGFDCGQHAHGRRQDNHLRHDRSHQHLVHRRFHQCQHRHGPGRSRCDRQGHGHLWHGECVDDLRGRDYAQHRHDQRSVCQRHGLGFPRSYHAGYAGPRRWNDRARRPDAHDRRHQLRFNGDELHVRHGKWSDIDAQRAQYRAGGERSSGHHRFPPARSALRLPTMRLRTRSARSAVRL